MPAGAPLEMLSVLDEADIEAEPEPEPEPDDDPEPDNEPDDAPDDEPDDEPDDDLDAATDAELEAALEDPAGGFARRPRWGVAVGRTFAAIVEGWSWKVKVVAAVYWSSWSRVRTPVATNFAGCH